MRLDERREEGGHPPLVRDLGEGPVVEQVDRVIRRAVELGASDVHVEPFEREVRVRYRLDGVLHVAGRLSPAQAGSLVARIKVLASLDVAEKRRPQDGRIGFPYEGREVDLRVSVVPTRGGEKVVLRVLDRAALRLDLAGLGLEGRGLTAVESALAAPHGMVLVTGPTGSGKTTTLYAALGGVDSTGLNVLTVEDPVEYELPGVNQTAVRPDLGFGFAEALRSFLRQDPDVIMVGEVRDAETAGIAVRAALTGHLVLSTLHTNDAASAPARLVDMGVEPYLLAATLRLVVAQRLVRTLCVHCKAPLEGAAEVQARALLAAEGVEPHDLRGPVGCTACGGTGYRGRQGVFEVLPVTEPIASAITRGASAAELQALEVEAGIRSLRASAASLLAAGQTTLEEVVRATGG